MMQKETITMDCLFLHETPTADLEREQLLLRSRYQETLPDSPLPFNIVPPFCLAPGRPVSGRLTVGPAENREGWIVLPVSGSDAAGGGDWQILNPPVFPGFPPLPERSSFILGYAGKAADTLLAELKRAETGPFSVQVWFEAKLTVTAEFDKDVSYGAFYDIGNGHWHKARK